MGGCSPSAGASVTGASTMERGLAVFSEAEHTLCPANPLLIKLQMVPVGESSGCLLCDNPMPISCSTHGYVVTSHTKEFCLFLNGRHVSEIVHFLLFDVWLLSFSIMFLRFIHVFAKHSDSCRAECPSVWMYHSLSILLLIDILAISRFCY